MAYGLLNQIASPDDLRKLDYRELEQLCVEIREFLIEKVSKTGGHLSSNLGVIELTVTLHRSFRSPQDMILFDVGHQSYTHKLLTGRQAGFDQLRSAGGIAGFPTPKESAHDIIHSGHGSAALSAAIGLAQAKKLKNEPGYVIVVVGDGAITGGMTYEGINNIDGLNNLLIVLNDNTMSISKNVGALAQYLTRLRTSPQYYKAKRDVKAMLDNAPVIGGGVVRGIQSMKSALRKGLYHSTFFEELGLRYIGPVDGHDIPTLYGIFRAVRQIDGPVLLHIETVKGKGYVPAERNPGAYHGLSAANPASLPDKLDKPAAKVLRAAKKMQDPDVPPSDSFSNTFGRHLARLGAQDERLCAITAAMKYGTGLQFFKKAHRERFFDVGMAEAHAVTFAGGLAAGGLHPVVALYSTFLQRAYDQFIHDIMLGERPVLLAVDRAGLVEGDGETHQGIYDVALLSQQPALPVVSPGNYQELTHWLDTLLKDQRGPAVIRYARGSEPAALADKACTGKPFDHLLAAPGAKAAIVSYGTETACALAAAEMLAGQGRPTDVFQMVVINPLPEGLPAALLGYDAILFAEEGIAKGGIGEHLAAALMDIGYKGDYKLVAVRDIHIDHATLPELRAQAGLDAQSLAATLASMLPAPRARAAGDAS